MIISKHVSCVMYGKCSNKINSIIRNEKECTDCPWNENYQGNRNIEPSIQNEEDIK